jgi:hypothetical protein
VVQSQPRKIVPQDSISKKPTTKRGLVEWLKVQALSSSPSTANKKVKCTGGNLLIWCPLKYTHASIF